MEPFAFREEVSTATEAQKTVLPNLKEISL